ncbi:hypothetical protein [Flavihumibacter fluvii]|uniref:hypothetical protein n=1 Tax=Flavihumibacter fluvii TaxID=2838157 RepID=UPI001BDF30C1|nr:hypothetical protein [Flavihumibacter fluvii]ULQ51068.1 hypothetical protein KJS93_13335 [Flavihumibacter fluvii]
MNKAPKRYWHFIAIAITVLSLGCYKKADVVIPKKNLPDGVNTSNVTYNNYVHTLLKNNCSTCHGKTGSAAAFWINTNTYENAVQYGMRIKETIVEGSMPPPPRSPFPQAEKDLLQAWIDRGMPE